MKRIIKEQNIDWNAISDKVWQDGVIIFDTNVLLNLYRYNEEARNELIDLMKSYESRLWMPYQVGLEFLANCESVKKWLHRGFEELEVQVDECKKNFFKFYDSHYSKHKHINRKELEDLFEQQLLPVKEKLCEWEKAVPDYDKKDVVKKKMVALFDKKVGNDYNYDELLDIYAKGKIRYDNKIPPGYKDDTKEKQLMGARHVYGDLIEWMQIMDYAKTENKDVIFVGEDLKEDWWEIKDGQINKPRQELLDEFRYRTGKDIVFHTQKGFIDASKKKMKKETIKEIDRVREENQLFWDRIKMANESFSRIMPHVYLSSLSKLDVPSYDEIHKLALSQNVEDFKKFRESLKSLQDNASFYDSLSEKLRKLNGLMIEDKKSK